MNEGERRGKREITASERMTEEHRDPREDRRQRRRVERTMASGDGDAGDVQENF